MAVRKIRRISFDGQVFFWRVSHRHAASREDCRDVFTAYAETHPRRPVRILFPWTADYGPGFPHQKGVVHDNRAPASSFNLNRPEVARGLIELALRAGWRPADQSAELVVENGFDFIRSHPERFRPEEL